MMIIYNYLKKDHEKVKELFDEIINSKSATKRDNLFNDLKQELLLHAEAEHATFYKTLKKHEETKELAKHGDKEHEEVKAYLEQLSASSSGNNAWMVLLGELKHAVEHHVKEEETQMFKSAKKVLDKETELNLVQQMEEFKEKYMDKVEST